MPYSTFYITWLQEMVIVELKEILALFLNVDDKASIVFEVLDTKLYFLITLEEIDLHTNRLN